MKAEGVAVVTGAGRGLGRAIALELAARGFEVEACVRRPEAGEAVREEASARGLRVEWRILDVTAPGDYEAPPGLRVFVHNAGIDRDWLPLERSREADWRALFETHVFGLVELSRRALPRLREAGGGVLCAITSCSILTPMPLFSAYRASKAAVSALLESLAVEVAPFGVRVLEVLPGAVRTEMLEAVAEPLPEAASGPYRELAERVHRARAASAGLGVEAAEAARAIADAILDDGAPLRVACDPMGTGLLEAWRQGGDEARLRGMIATFAAPPAGGSGR